MRRNPIFVSGFSAHTPAGQGISLLWEMCHNHKNYLADGFGRLPIKDDNRALTIATALAEDALQNAGIDALRPDDGLILATTTAHAALWEPELIKFIKGGASGDFPRFSLMPLGSLLNQLTERLNFRGRRQLITSACAAGVHAIALGAEWVRSGLVSRCLVGGTEVICELVSRGFSSLKLLSSSPCKPFDADRMGINLSEGGAFLCLEAKPKSAPLGKISGVGLALDGYHMTAPHPEGDGSLRAMKEALHDAGVSPSQIDWIHAHGTGSIHNDLAESVAIQRLFHPQTIPPVTSTKGAHGHFLGVSGIVEVGLILESIRRQIVLGTVGCENLDARLNLPVQRGAAPISIRHVLKNILGFGGSNGALVVSRA